MIGDWSTIYMLKPGLFSFIISKLLLFDIYISKYKYILFLYQLVFLLYDTHYLRAIILAIYYSISLFLIVRTSCLIQLYVIWKFWYKLVFIFIIYLLQEYYILDQEYYVSDQLPFTPVIVYIQSRYIIVIQFIN